MPNTTGELRSGPWQAEQLRFTAFLKTAPDSPENWWNTTIGEDPSETVVKPREGFTEYRLASSDRITLLRIHFARVDWFILAPNDLDSVSDAMTSGFGLGAFDTTASTMRDLASRWLQIAPACSRLALGVQLTQATKDKITGYETLQKYLPMLTLDPIHSSDFLYRINRPTQASFGGISVLINKLSTWSVLQRRLLQFPLVPGAAQFPVQATGEDYSCRMELDINTDMDSDLSDMGIQLNAVLSELFDLAFSVSKQGDR